MTRFGDMYSKSLKKVASKARKGVKKSKKYAKKGKKITKSSMVPFYQPGLISTMPLKPRKSKKLRKSKKRGY